ncbi:MAG: DNA gyrase inhibitor YacG [Hyphomicrobiales bacterium]
MAEPITLRPRRPCPICKKPSQQKYHPFCSSHCAQVDLGRWLGGRYAVPAEEAEVPASPPESDAS